MQGGSQIEIMGSLRIAAIQPQQAMLGLLTVGILSVYTSSGNREERRESQCVYFMTN